MCLLLDGAGLLVYLRREFAICFWFTHVLLMSSLKNACHLRSLCENFNRNVLLFRSLLLSSDAMSQIPSARMEVRSLCIWRRLGGFQERRKIEIMKCLSPSHAYLLTCPQVKQKTLVYKKIAYET